MRRIIEGKVYDTATADWLANMDSLMGKSEDWLANMDSLVGKSDFRYWREDLYRTKKGAYFLVGKGKTMSHWAEHTGNGNEGGPGEGIRVLTEKEAREWVEKYANSQYERIFGAAEEA